VVLAKANSKKGSNVLKVVNCENELQ